MSGIEVAGLILGILPLLITAAEYYIKSVPSSRKYVRELKNLKRGLEVQQVLLQDTCEQLLVQVVGGHDIEAMLREPFGDLWRDEHISGLVQERLWKSCHIFKETVKDMQSAVGELQKKLGVPIQPQMQQPSSSSISRGIYRAKYMLRRSQYKEFLDIIAEGNATLTQLLRAGMDSHVRPARRLRSQGRLFKLTRDLSKNLFNALRCSISCQCPVSHGVNLELLRPSVWPTPQDDDELVVQKIFFQVTLSCNPGDRKGKQTTWGWDEIKLRAEVQSTEEPPTSEISSNKAHQSPKKRVQFLNGKIPATWGPTSKRQDRPKNDLRSTLPTAMASINTIALAGITIQPQLPDVKDLCGAIQKGRHQQRPECYGYITDSTASKYNTFRVHPLGTCEASSSWSILSLGDVLDGKVDSLPLLGFRHRQNLAVTIASNILQLSDSPWLPEMLTSDDVLFIRRDDRTMYDRVFVAKRLPDCKAVGPTPSPHDSVPVIQNRLLFSLGVLLLELALGKRLHRLRKPDEKPTTSTSAIASSAGDLLLDYDTAVKHLDRVKMDAGEMYGRAVRHCIKCEFMASSFDLAQEDFQDEVYSKVVALLESNVEMMDANSRTF